mgnify:CR=1 FL=1
MNKFLITIGALLSLINFSNAQDKDAKKWDIEKPTGITKTINFNTNEGTFMNLDVSPDGKTIVFDLLGDIYKAEGKINKAIPQLISAPVVFEMPVRTFNPKPQPPMLPMLKANPPNTINMDKR